MPRIHQGGGCIALRLGVERRHADDGSQQQQQSGGERKAEQRREQQRFADLLGFRPIDARGAVAAAHDRVITPTPMIEPIKVCELDAGKPKAQVPRFHRIAAINSANTMANPALLPTCRINSTGKQRDDAEGDRARGGEHADRG